MMKAYLVLGPERSGTRLMTRILIASGCFGDDGHDQRLDKSLPDPEMAPVIVWRRSLPHRQEWPNLQVMINSLRGKGYDVQAIITPRDWFAVAQSQVSENLVSDVDVSYRHQQRAYSTIFAELMLNKVPFVVVSYEHLVQRPKPVITRLMEYLGLPALLATGVEVYDGNEKWYAG
jgi:LPS sulfotransferase NodH